MALSKNFTNQISKDFHTSLKENNLGNIKTKIIDKYESFLKETTNKGLITSLLRYGIKAKDENIINSVIKKVSMKRDYFDLMLYYNNIEYSKILFSQINKELILGEDIEFIIKNNLIFLLPYLDGKFIPIDYPNQSVDTTCLKKYKLLNCEKYYNTIINKINTEFSQLNKINYDVIIDAGNILHSRNGEPNISDLEFVIKSFKNPLIVIHKRHLKNKQLKNFIKDYNYIETPYIINDDHYILLAYLKNNCKIITNDKYSDHTFENNDFRFYVMDDIINYTNKNGNIIFNEVKPYSNCIQIINSDIYIPTINGGFIQIKKNE